MTERGFKELGFLNPFQHIQAKSVYVDTIKRLAADPVASRLLGCYSMDNQ
jgi:hypothetical protein